MTVSDLIRRQDAIDAFECNMYLSPKQVLESLPSATCDDCIWHTCNYNKVDWDGEEGYISKRDTIRLLVEKYKFTTKEARERLAELPSADP